MTVPERLNLTLNTLTDKQEYSWDWTRRATSPGGSNFMRVVSLDIESVKGKEKSPGGHKLFHSAFLTAHPSTVVQLRDPCIFVDCMLMYMNDYRRDKFSELSDNFERPSKDRNVLFCYTFKYQVLCYRLILRWRVTDVKDRACHKDPLVYIYCLSVHNRLELLLSFLYNK